LRKLERPLDPKATDYDFGFKVQAMYGTDARYTHYLGELDYIINDRSQLTPVEVWGIVHTPWLFSGGIDIKAGQWVTLEGAETIDPTTNYLYSHSYIDRAELLDGNLTILGTTHIGPENLDTNGTNNTTDSIMACHCNPNNTLRFLDDITATWKVTDPFTLITDANYIHDDGTYFDDADSFGTFHPSGIRHLQGQRLAETCRTRRGLAGQQQFLCRGLPWQFRFHQPRARLF
jgi:Putative beta-barrel porin-2, OmpL-like. bbp2